jgi:hypothetical protein
MARKRTRTVIPEPEPVSAHARYLNAAEVQSRRLELAKEMVGLLLRDGARLPAAAKHDLQGIGQTLETLVQAAKMWRPGGQGSPEG